MVKLNDASLLKDKGSSYFKEGRLNEAAEYYSKAEAAAAIDPVHPSNLSVAFYELGKYSECVDAILRSWVLLSLESHASLVLKLSARLPKALCHGVRSGVISSSAVEARREMIEIIYSVVLKKSSEDTLSYEGHEKLWACWRRVDTEPKDRETTSKQARARLAQLPNMRKSLHPAVGYFTIGQDRPMSLMDDWGEGDQFPFNLNTLSPEQLSQVAFLFGGVGDARHAYGSIIGAHRAFKLLSKTKRSKMHVHFTLLDIHTGVLARDLCIMMLLDHLIEGKGDSVAQEEIKLTVFYTFAGVAMPSYCYARLQDIIIDVKARLQKHPASLPAWLYINSDAIPGIVDALDFWSTTEQSTSHMLRDHAECTGSDPSALLSDPLVSPAYKESIRIGLQAQR